MMNLLKESKSKKTDNRKRKDEFLCQLRGEDYDREGFLDDYDNIRQATQDSIQSQYEWQRRQEFRQRTSGWNNIYEEGRSSHGSVAEYYGERTRKSTPSDSEFSLRRAVPELVRSKSSKQPRINDSLLKSLRKKMGEAVSKFLIYDRLPFQLASSPWLHNLITVAAEVGKHVKLPTPYEVSDVYLESEYQQIGEWVKGLQTQWNEMGATLMCDGWTNSLTQMHIINFLVYCRRGTIFWKSVNVSSVQSRDTNFYFNLLDEVVEEIGEKAIIQIVTDNEAAMKAAGKRLMEKRKHLYWTACSAHCLDLCLEDIGKKKNVGEILEQAKRVTCFIYNHIWTVDLLKKYTNGKQILRPALTRFATHFIQLEEIVRQKQALRNMFNSKEFKESKWGEAKSGPAYEAKKIVLGKEFWKKASDIIKVYVPLVKVLRLVDSDDKPTMGFIYEAIDRAKRAIQADCRYSSEYQRIIDERWRFMHCDLHSAGYYLNPQFQFGVEHSADVYKETLAGTRAVISRLEPCIDTQIRMLNQLIIFKDKKETFGTPQAQRAWKQMNPADWWTIYGTCVPELQNVAIKVLSQTTSASNCERNWSTFSYIHTKARNRLKYERLQKLVYTYYNMRLKMRHQERMSNEELNDSFNPISLDHIFEDDDPLTDWLQEKEAPLLDGDNSNWLPVDNSDDDMELDQSHQSQERNESNSSSSSPTPSQSGDGSAPGNDGGGGDNGENRSHSPYVGDYGLAGTGGMFFDPTQYGVNQSGEPSEGVRRSKRKGKKKQYDEGSWSCGMESNSNNFGYSESSESTQGYYPLVPPSYVQSHYPYLPPPGYYSSQSSSFPNYYNSYQPHMYPPPQMYSGAPQVYQGGVDSTGLYDFVFGQMPEGGGQSDSQSGSRGLDPPRHSTMW